jgi:hypothetical protein
MQILDKQTADPLFTASISARHSDAARKQAFENVGIQKTSARNYFENQTVIGFAHGE